MKNISAVILAAGEGTRMNSNIPKILHRLGSRPMLGHVLDNVRLAGVGKIFVITGYRSAMVAEYVGSRAQCVEQKELRGTGDAVWQIRNEPELKHKDARLLVLYADTPLISAGTLRRLLETHTRRSAAGTLLTAVLKDPTGYGRIMRNDQGTVIKIIEEQEAGVFEKAIEEINVGVYVFKAGELFEAINLLKPDNKKQEYYLTDVVEIMYRKNQVIDTVETADSEEIIGVNSRPGLAGAYEILRRRILEQISSGGVTILDPATTFIDDNVAVGRDTVIYPFTIIEKDVIIGENCSLGPFCRIRGGCRIADRVSIGNFVEINRTRAGTGARLKHHAYLGDALIGENVNIGAGTITANFDGKEKNQTIIQDGAFIGTGTILVAPVKIGKMAVTGAGTVVTKNKNVPDKTVVVGVPARELVKKTGKNGVTHGSKRKRG